MARPIVTFIWHSTVLYWGYEPCSDEKVAARTSGWLLPADRSIARSEFTFFNYSISMHAWLRKCFRIMQNPASQPAASQPGGSGADSQSQLACCCSGAFLRSRKGSELGKSMGDPCMYDGELQSWVYLALFSFTIVGVYFLHSSCLAFVNHFLWFSNCFGVKLLCPNFSVLLSPLQLFVNYFLWFSNCLQRSYIVQY